MIDMLVEMKLTQYKWDNIFKPALEEILNYFEFEPVEDGHDTNTHKSKFVSDKSMRTLQCKYILCINVIFPRITNEHFFFYFYSHIECIQLYFR